MSILGEMRRYPVHNNAQTGLMCLVHKIHQVMRRAIPRSRGKIAGYLIAPRTVKRVLGERHTFNVGVPHLLCVRDQFIRELAIGIERAVFIPLPRTQVHFINVHRLFIGRMLLAPIEPAFILPGVAFQVKHLGCIAWPGFRMETIWIRLIQFVAFRCFDRIFICVILLDARDKQFPYPAIIALHGMSRTIPIVEFAHNGNADGIRRKNAENIALLSIAVFGVRAHKFIGTAVLTRMEQRHMLLQVHVFRLSFHAFISS